MVGVSSGSSHTSSGTQALVVSDMLQLGAPSIVTVSLAELVALKRPATR